MKPCIGLEMMVICGLFACGDCMLCGQYYWDRARSEAGRGGQCEQPTLRTRWCAVCGHRDQLSRLLPLSLVLTQLHWHGVGCCHLCHGQLPHPTAWVSSSPTSFLAHVIVVTTQIKLFLADMTVVLLTMHWSQSDEPLLMMCWDIFQCIYC